MVVYTVASILLVQSVVGVLTVILIWLKSLLDERIKGMRHVASLPYRQVRSLLDVMLMVLSCVLLVTTWQGLMVVLTLTL